MLMYSKVLRQFWAGPMAAPNRQFPRLIRVLLLEYAKDTRGVSPEMIARAKRYVQLGYGRLLSYQAPDGGITYWGGGILISRLRRMR